ncbi:MAG: molybdenum ABC transporter ATP-binding protein [Syntrophorhabdaceae bacterium]|nr:molybdenum ABC transporter ATP-binding protein [Syntrophorhabdaceae bacterium]
MELRVAVEKNFGRFLLNADLSVRGKRIGIFGPSGGGKSTLVGLIAGLSKPDRGIITLDGEILFDSSSGINVRTEDRRMGMVFQRPSLFPHLNVKGNLLYGYKRCAPENRKIVFGDVVEVLNIGRLLDSGVKKLSGGEKQRVAIGRAVLGNPRLLLLDEPLSALDDSLKFQIVPFLKNACEAFGIPYLFISHSLLEIRIMTDQVLNVVNGRIVGQATAEALVRSRMGDSMAGYMNLLRLSAPRQVDALYAYMWGGQQLVTASGDDRPEGLFELSSTDIMLFKSHPEAISARNLLKCRVVGTFQAGNRVGVDLDCNGDGRLVAEVVRQAADELGVRAGAEVYAAIKSTAFRKLG